MRSVCREPGFGIRDWPTLESRDKAPGSATQRRMGLAAQVGMRIPNPQSQIPHRRQKPAMLQSTMPSQAHAATLSGPALQQSRLT